MHVVEYTGGMYFFVVASKAPRLKAPYIRTLGIAYAVLLTIMVVGQLFSYENFAMVLQQLGLRGGEPIMQVCAAALAVLEVGSIPFLLRMELSGLARIVSMIALWLSALSWLAIAIESLTTVGAADNIGILGDTVAIPGGWWAVFYGMALCVLAAWVSWGMYPLEKNRT